MIKEYNIEEEIAPFYAHLLMNLTLRNIVLQGGRGCTKSYFNARKIAFHLIFDKSCSVVAIRQNLNTHKDSTFAEICKALDDMGAIYTSTVSPLQIRVGENVVYFRGMDDYEKLKGMTSSKSPIKIIWFFEITEFKSSMDMAQARSTLVRGGTKARKNYFISLYEYNPPPTLSHWVYEWQERYQDRDDYYFQHNTYEDLGEKLQKEWLGEIMMDEIATMKAVDFETYKHIYLGLPAQVIGMIYKNFSREHNLVDINLNAELAKADNKAIHIGIDYGETDATTAYSSLMKVDKRVLTYREYYHKNGVSPIVKTVVDYAEDLYGFIMDVQKDAPSMPIYVYVDSASKSIYQLLRQMVKHPRIAVLQVNKSKKLSFMKGQSGIHERITVTNMMMATQHALIDNSCVNLVKAFETAEYHEITGDRIDNGAYNIDSLDAWEYSWLVDLLPIYNLITTKVGQELRERE